MALNSVDAPSPDHPFAKPISNDSDSEEGGVGSGERASVRRDSVDHHDSTGSSDEISKKGKSVAIDISQNEQFTHRLLPSQSPEFDNVINQVNYENRQTDRQTDKQIDRQTDRQTNRQTDRRAPI